MELGLELSQVQFRRPGRYCMAIEAVLSAQRLVYVSEVADIAALPSWSVKQWKLPLQIRACTVRYLAGNMRQLDLGVQRYGAMVAVLRSDVVRHRAVVVGTDSGGWESCCNKSVTPVHKQSWIEKLLEEGTQAEANKILNGETVHDCELSLHCGPAASTPLGVSEMHLHSFLANTRTFHTVGGGAARLTYQLLEEGADVRPIEGNMYTEAALLGDFVVDDVKVLVGSFPGLFGSELGDKLRSFCLRHGVPLAWGLGNSRPWPVEEKQLLDWLPMEPFEYWHGAGVRLLDPIAGWALTNSTQGGGAETLAVWKQVWTQIAHERQVRNGGLTRAEFQTWWQHIAVQDYPVKGLRGAGCPDDVCFGTIEAGGKRDCPKSEIPTTLPNSLLRGTKVGPPPSRVYCTTSCTLDFLDCFQEALRNMSTCKTERRSNPHSLYRRPAVISNYSRIQATKSASCRQRGKCRDVYREDKT
eukprot:s1395_g11.t1